MATTKAKQNGRVVALQSFKAVVQPVYCERNEQGEVTAEFAGDDLQFVIYAPDFDNLREKLDALIPDIQQAVSRQ